ncbi:MAG: dipeptidase PepV [Firmicutes bacterium]|nr:dipeptidase PepV [Bacillota bacterium]
MISTEKYRDAVVKTTVDLIKIPSVKEPGTKEKPFGEPIDHALRFMLDKGQELGFDTKNYDGYAGHIEFGEGEEILGILCHLDVVPAGDDWSYPPFEGEIAEGKLYGRGTLDNKGPAVAVLYAMAALKDAGFTPHKRIRLILGTDEESGWECMQHYLAHAEKPDLGFTPDAVFPIINAEKGIVMVRLQGPWPEKEGYSLMELRGGHRANMVPDRCLIRLSGGNMPALDEFLPQIGANEAQVSVNSIGAAVEIEVRGVSAHGSTPEKGVNAIAHALKILGGLGFDGGLTGLLADKVGFGWDGEGLNLKLSDADSGPLTLNLGVIKSEAEHLSAELDIRYPISFSKEEILQRLRASLPDSVSVTTLDSKPPLFVSPESKLIKVLQDVYTKHTGDPAELIAIGGGTYARALDNAVAFGPLFPGREELAHQKDEHISVDDLLIMTRIFDDAIARLAEEDGS